MRCRPYDPSTLTACPHRTAPPSLGSLQSELGCSDTWNTTCPETQLAFEPDDDGRSQFLATAIPVGDYESKFAINQSLSENYGADGAPDGAIIPFTVPKDDTLVTASLI